MAFGRDEKPKLS